MKSPEIEELVSFLRRKSKENEAPIWGDIAERLSKPRRNIAAVNLSRIGRCSANGETILVPGKILGAGSLDHEVKVAALRFSESARRKIERAGGKCLSIPELVNENPRGSGVKILG
ncbi:MAG: 50S ribosomal protein L18e [Candidatus Bathyarchaeia archaeon]